MGGHLDGDAGLRHVCKAVAVGTGYAREHHLGARVLVIDAQEPRAPVSSSGKKAM